MSAEIKVGDVAPDFSVTTDTDGIFRLSDHKGSNIIVYFYPKDDTSGCTSQAIDFSTAKEELEDMDTKVVGISADSIDKHRKFRDKHSLTIMLGSDPDHNVLENYGVWVEKSMYGRKYMGIERSTYIIDKEGVIKKIWRKVKVKNHIKEVIAEVSSFTND